MLVVGGTDTSSRRWSPASPSPVPHSRGPRPGSPEVSGIGLRPCGPQVRARRTFLDRRPVRSRVVAVQGQYLQQCSPSSVVLVAAV
ncbi:hypothetical protein Taro_005985 [Colocasia esculenta]|uniref:Uncharacterized protein n=1 Tax=Colocasia esculenta TaxID=4460 RepID=A0A843TPU2_COLES|nr:hypothetical protein [Colocasia esculenta]